MFISVRVCIKIHIIPNKEALAIARYGIFDLKSSRNEELFNVSNYLTLSEGQEQASKSTQPNDEHF